MITLCGSHPEREWVNRHRQNGRKIDAAWQCVFWEDEKLLSDGDSWAIKIEDESLSKRNFSSFSFFFIEAKKLSPSPKCLCLEYSSWSEREGNKTILKFLNFLSGCIMYLEGKLKAQWLTSDLLSFPLGSTSETREISLDEVLTCTRRDLLLCQRDSLCVTRAVDVCDGRSRKKKMRDDDEQKGALEGVHESSSCMKYCLSPASRRVHDSRIWANKSWARKDMLNFNFNRLCVHNLRPTQVK